MATAPGAPVREPAAREPSTAVRIGDMRLWRSALIASILICAAYPAVAPGHVVSRNVLYNVGEAGAILAIAVFVSRYRPSAAHAWLLLAGGLSMFWIGDMLWAVYEIGGRDPYPSPADIFYIAGYPLLAAGLFAATRRRMPIIDTRAPIDAAIVAVGALLFQWFYVIGPTLADSTLSLTETVVTITYPVADVILLAVAVRFVMGRGWNVVALRLLVLGLGLTLLGDMLFSLDVVSRLNSRVYVVDAMLLAGALLIGLAAAHPSMTVFTAEAREPDERAHVRRLILIAGVCLLPPVLLIVQALQGKPLYLPATLTGMVLLAGLVIARFTHMTTSASRAADREAALSRYSAQLLRSNGRDELLRVASLATIELLGDGHGGLVPTGSDPPAPGHAITVPVDVRGEVPAVLVADVKPASVRRVRDSLTTIAAGLSLALEREHLLESLRQAADALTEQNEQLRELDHMKDQFVSSVSHELRTPLTSMVGYLELVLDGEAGDLGESQRRLLEKVSRSCDRLNRLVDDILVVARIDAGKFSLEKHYVDLVELTEAAVESARIAAERGGVELRVSAPEAAVPLWADSTRVSQMLDNLLSNAIKFTPKGGRVAVTLARHEDAALLQVRDTGVGIPEEEIGALFERFFRASTGLSVPGTGLGLPIVKAIVEAHDGWVTVESTVGVGTTFTVELPLQSRSPFDSRIEEVAT
jgi:signal transduction histidine kinase